MRTYRVKNIDKIRETVKKLNLFDTGESFGSNTRDRVIVDEEIPACFFVAKEASKVVGWCIRFKDKETHVFVSKRQRRKGYGSRLIKRMTKEVRGVCLVVPWSSRAKSFFSKHYGKKIRSVYA